MKRLRYILAAGLAIVLCVMLFGRRAKVIVDEFRDLGEVREALSTYGRARQGPARNVTPDPTRYTLRPEDIKSAKDFIFVLGQGISSAGLLLSLY